MTISCTFENRLDSSPKSCSVKYGTCGQEMYTTQGNTIDEFIIRLKLNSSIASLMNCYVVTASNGTYDIMVNGSLNLAMREGANNAVLSVIVVPVVGLVVGAIIIVIGVIFGKRRWGNQFLLYLTRTIRISNKLWGWGGAAISPPRIPFRFENYLL